MALSDLSPACRRCTECSDGPPHHFSEVIIGLAENEPEHPAAKAGLAAWYTCKHCPAWHEDPDEESPPSGEMAVTTGDDERPWQVSAGFVTGDEIDEPSLGDEAPR